MLSEINGHINSYTMSLRTIWVVCGHVTHVVTLDKRATMGFIIYWQVTKIASVYW